MPKKARTALLQQGSSEFTSSIWRYSFFLIIAVAIPNAPFIATASYFELFRPLVNFDYILATLLVVAGYRLFGLCVLLASLSFDIFSVVPQVFPAIGSPSDLLELLPFAFLAPRSYLLAIASTLFFCALLVIVLLASGRRADPKAGLIVLNLSLFIYLYYLVYDSSQAPNLRKGVREGSFIASQVANYFDYRETFWIKATDRSRDLRNVSYTGQLASWQRKVEEEFPQRSLLIINESWGANIDPRINQALLRPIINSQVALHDIQYGDVEFIGATVQAELRELCAQRELEEAYNDNFKQCIPNRLRQAGYATYAMHGADGSMYRRANWYPLIGFDKQTFFESRPWPNRCNSFPGACDLDMREEITDYFSLPGKRFMYWMTLNTHSWYDSRDIRKDVFDCAEMHVKEDTSTCRYLKLQAQFFYGLAEIIDDPRMAGVTIRIIGDHPPPIAVASERFKYFKEGSIGWLQFTIPDNGVIGNIRAQKNDTPGQ